MRKLLIAAMSIGLGVGGFAGQAMAGGAQVNNVNQLPHCDHPLGTAAVKEPDRDWWTPLGLSNPEAVIKLFALRSGCLRMVDRNGGLHMRDQERSLNDSGDLQRGSNIGRGQVLAADFFIIPDIARRIPTPAAATSAAWPATSCPAASARWPAASACRARKPTPC